MSELQQLDSHEEEEIADMADQYVTFFLGDEAFAFPMASVLEIVRIPQTVEVPLTPGSLVGLANLRGSVLPILELRRLLGMEEVEFNDATRVIVADAGRPVGLIVDKVARVMNIDPRNIESADRVGSTIDSSLLVGVAKNVDNHALIQLLNVEKVIKQEFGSIIDKAANHEGGELGGVAALEQSSHDEGEEDTRQLVSFMVDNQEYAFDIEDVEEIVRVPESISRVPHAEPHVLGLINLRESLLPLVNLRTLFAMPESELDEHHRILVLSLRRSGQRESVGIVVDQVREVLRITPEVQDKVPSMLRQGEKLNEIAAVCRLEQGKRLVSVLTADELFAHPSIQQALESRDSQQEELAVVNQSSEGDEAITEEEETQLVVFQLAGQEFGVSIESVQEITRVPEQMTRVPKTPAFIEGMVNLRGAVLPVLDMRIRFGLERMERNERQRILVLDLKGTRTGFITDAVLEVLRLNRKVIEQAPPLSDEQSRIMGQVVNFRDKKRMIQVLSVSELLDEQERRDIQQTL
ncbi:purine-binding chemotaxis protein CheW [Ectothiorhodospiraceae bacterium BW-2]|nr:purine-binding chemotaxis protein CheW [Ectothiorhodospiraceae bacterium BW-2]